MTLGGDAQTVRVPSFGGGV